ncbi:hypothetical protein A8924_6277 [Saccharopolyspora erythraea NRRL 2338]|uniref:Uncharacterized protein n=2 Tax=Saccharopolyspora erythraea TaxID=1836 RepID=A4FM39_SACEN|nr:hypothetical protein [Saccharopolyspora erythraea]EQD84620.1 hypothetical protein N599_19110 [Saccharopolyspora erythraea D]PFG98753.1 hypothetical protein A8924_6277 [Saccharopolyspora erythraea NRRL 2338]QRK88760.1 hypothetical protein JQX30_29715 [Saccharopolyspora erythraea]CAM05114.1 hypothetical protein SACE_5931 [Saccharopolyspora erythraea NRRL 2338]
MTGSLPNTQRETAPLKRDNSRVRPENRSEPPDPEEAGEEKTRPAFPQPSAQQPAASSGPHQVGQQHPAASSGPTQVTPQPGASSGPHQVGQQHPAASSGPTQVTPQLASSSGPHQVGQQHPAASSGPTQVTPQLASSSGPHQVGQQHPAASSGPTQVTPQPGASSGPHQVGQQHPAASSGPTHVTPQPGASSGPHHVGQAHPAASGGPGYQPQQPHPTAQQPMPQAHHGQYPSNPPHRGPQPTAKQPYPAQPQQAAPGHAPAAGPGNARAAETRRPAGGVTPMGWLLRAAGLCAVAVISGLLWIALKPGSEPEPQAQDTAPRTKYQFAPVTKEDAFQGCKSISTSRIAQFFARQECDHLTRALYTTTLPDGDKVLTSVVTVLMPTPQSATELDELTTKNNTGNIKDLVEDGRQAEKNFPDLNDHAYASQRQDRLVVIGDSAYIGKKTPAKDPALLEVTRDALQLGRPQDQAPQ